MLMASLLPRAVALSAAVVLLASAPARAAAGGESTPVDLSGVGADRAASSGGGSIVRTIVGLAVVIGVIYGVAWVLKQVKAGKEERSTGAGLASIASVPLGSGRAVHLVRAGSDLVLVGVTEHGITPLRTYDEAQARAAGLLDEDGDLILPPGPPVKVRARASVLARDRRTTTGQDAPRKPRLALPAGGISIDTLRAMTVRR